MQMAQCLSSSHLWPELKFSSCTAASQDELTYTKLMEKLCLLSHPFWGDPTFWTHSSLTKHLIFPRQIIRREKMCWIFWLIAWFDDYEEKKTTNNVSTLLYSFSYPTSWWKFFERNSFFWKFTTKTAILLSKWNS